MLALMSTGGLLEGCKSDSNGKGVDGGVAAIDVYPTTGLQTTEQGGASQAATFAVVLRTAPTADVTIMISSADASEGTVGVSSLTFTTLNWASPQTVTVTGVDDDEADGDVTYSIITAPATSTDLSYAGVNPADVSVKNVDNDSAGIRAQKTTGLTTTEAGGTAKFEVVLNTQPTADVVVPISSSDTGEVTVANPTLTFTTTNWNSPQEVTVKGVDDDAADGNIEVTITSNGATSTDTRYVGKKFDDVKVSNIDNDSAGFVIEPLIGLETSEGGTTDTFTVKLTTQPTADVVLPLSSASPLEVSVDKTSLTFTAENWAAAQTVTVTGVDDNLQDGDQIFVISTAPAMSADGRYDGRNPDDVGGLNADNDTPGFTLTDYESIVVSESGSTDTFYVRLKTRPSTDVSVAVTSDPTTEATVTPATLVFTIDNWASPHPVTVKGVDDTVQDGDQQFAVLLAPATGDEAYAGLDPMNVTGTTLDNDSPAVRVVAASNLEVSEAGNTVTFTVGLATTPTADVTIPISSGTPTEVSATPTSLTFTTTDWAPKTVTLTGVDDSVADGTSTVVITIGQATSSDIAYAALAAQTLSVANIDNDQAGVALLQDNSPQVTTEDGGQYTFWIYLRSAPTANVTFPVLLATNEATAVTTSVTFTPSNWSGPQPVIIQGLDDTPPLKDGDMPYVVTVGPSTSTDSAYAGLSRQVTLTNEDNDTPGLRVTQDILTGNSTLITSEAGGTARFRVSLRTQPTADVVIPVTSLDTNEGTTSTSLVTITPAEWNAVNWITVNGVNDLATPVADGDRPYIITVGPATSTDPDYDGLTGDNVDVVNQDDDTPRLNVVNPSAPDPIRTLEGDTVPKTVLVSLGTAPQAEVTVTVEVVVTGEVTQDEVSVQPSTLTFTASNYAGQQSVSVFGLADIMQDGMKPYTLRFVPTSTDPRYNDPALTETVQGENEDVDSPGISITELAMVSSEVGGEAVFTIRLLQAPTGNVVIPLSTITVDQGRAVERYEGYLFNPLDPDFVVNGASSTDGAMIPTLTFTTANYAAPQQVTVKGIDDNITDGTVDYYVRIGPLVSTDPNYGGRNMPNLKLTNTDDETAGITASGVVLTSGRINVPEAGPAVTGSYRLNTRPRGDVVFTFTSADTTQLTVSPMTVTFTPANWNVNQDVTFTAVNDFVDDGDIPIDVAMAIAAADDPPYVALSQNVPVRAVDNDEANVVITHGGPVTVNETGLGSTHTFQVRLASQPTASVFVPVVSGDTTEGVVTVGGNPIPMAGIEFTTMNWNTDVDVVITAQDDMFIDGDVPYGISVGPATSADPNYGGNFAQTVTVTTEDTDSAEVIFGPALGAPIATMPDVYFEVDEAGDTQTYSLVLTSRPSADMVLGLGLGAEGDEVTISPATLTFTTTDWDQPHNFTVTGVNDQIDDGTVTFEIVWTGLTGGDANFVGQVPTPSPFRGRNADDSDQAGVTLPATFALSVFEDEASTNDTIAVVLDSQPTSDVTVTATLQNSPMVYDPTAATVNGMTPSAALTFTSANWNVPQNITVAGVNDGTYDGLNRGINVIFTTSSVDPNYNAIGGLTTYAGTVYERAQSCRRAKQLWPADTLANAQYLIDPDLDGSTAEITVYCDMTTDSGGWTLLSYAPNTNATGGVPYPGVSGGTVCNTPSIACGLTPGLGVAGGAQLTALLRAATEFGQGQSTVPITVAASGPFQPLGSYTYAGKYTYPANSLATFTLGSAAGTCTALATGTFTALNMATTTPSQAVFLADQFRTGLAGDYGSNSYTWSVGVPTAACSLVSAAPSSLLGPWQNPQYGPQVVAADGAYAVYVR